MDKAQLILPASYLPPVSYFVTLCTHWDRPILIEQFEHYPKQTYRSRATILGANGKLDLYIPVQKGKAVHTVMKDVRISYDADWQRLHWMSLQTAYRSSAYFEYYEDDFATFYNKQYEFLLDYNIELTLLILRLLKIDVEIALTESFRTDVQESLDFRTKIHPKKPAVAFTQPYHQVFSDRFDFIPDLSIVDLLFNQGPRSNDILLAPHS